MWCATFVCEQQQKKKIIVNIFLPQTTWKNLMSLVKPISPRWNENFSSMCFRVFSKIVSTFLLNSPGSNVFWLASRLFQFVLFRWSEHSHSVFIFFYVKILLNYKIYVADKMVVACFSNLTFMLNMINKLCATLLSLCFIVNSRIGIALVEMMKNSNARKWSMIALFNFVK